MTESRRANKPQYFPALDGLRGAGIMAMLLYHTNLGLASGAFLAISMFFTLSGYLIGGQLLAEFERSGRIDLAGFWERRLRRLLPAASLGLGSAVAYTVFCARQGEVARFAGDIFAALFYVPNWRFVVTGQSYEAIFTSPSPVQHFWSLGIEEQFYLGLPLLLWSILAKGSTRQLAIVVGSIVLLSAVAMWVLRIPGAPLGHAYYGTDARVAEVLLGVLLAIWLRGNPRFESHRSALWIHCLGIGAAIASLALWWTTSESDLWFYRGGALAYAAGTATIIAACIRPGPLQRILSFKPLIYVGNISYGLYVYHWPTYLFIDAADLGLSPPLLLLAKLAATFAVSALSHRFIEQPIRKRAWFTGARGWLAPPTAMAVVACAAAAVLFTARTVAPIEEVHFELPSRPASAPARQGRTAADSGSVEQAPPRIIVVGDSMAGNIGNGLTDWGAETGAASFAVHSIPACGLALEGERRHENATADMTESSCRVLQMHWAGQQYLRRYDAIVLIIGTMDVLDRQVDGWSDFRTPGDPVFDDWLVGVYQSALDLLVARNVQVVWLTYPCAGSEQYLRGHMSPFGLPLIAAAAFDIERIRHLNEQLLPRLRDSRPGDVTLVDLFGHVCPGGSFMPGLGSVAEARDDGVHFGKAGGRELANWLGPQILNALGREITREAPPSPDQSQRGALDPGQTQAARE